MTVEGWTRYQCDGVGTAATTGCAGRHGGFEWERTDDDDGPPVDASVTDESTR